MMTTRLLYQGANSSKKDEKKNTPLHFAVKKNMKNVCTKLLEHGAKADAENAENVMPYTIALEDRNDDIAAMLIRKMKNESHVNHNNFLEVLLV